MDNATVSEQDLSRQVLEREALGLKDFLCHDENILSIGAGKDELIIYFKKDLPSNYQRPVWYKSIPVRHVVMGVPTV